MSNLPPTLFTLGAGVQEDQEARQGNQASEDERLEHLDPLPTDKGFIEGQEEQGAQDAHRFLEVGMSGGCRLR